MANRPTISTLGAGAVYDTTTLNTNFTALRNAFDNLLGRNGTSGDNNTWTGDQDAGGYRLRNVVIANEALATSFAYDFDSSTTLADPGTGEFRWNHATVSSVTGMAISATTNDSGNPDISDWIVTWDDSDSTVKGTVTFRKVGSPSTFAIFNVTGSVTDNSTWLQLTLAYVDHNGSWTAADDVTISFVRAGDKGATGATGDTGPQGPAGTGDVTGPGSATDNAVARFDGVTGSTLQNSGVLIDDTDNITGVASIVVNNDGLKIKDSNASHNLTISTDSNLTADHTVNINPGDADRALTLSGDATISGTNTGDQNVFGTIAVSGQSDVVADATGDTLTLAAGSGVTITTNAGTDTITFAVSSTQEWEHVSSTEASASSEIPFTGFEANYDYMVSWSNIDLSTAANILAEFGTGAGPTYSTAGYDEGHHGYDGASAVAATANSAQSNIKLNIGLPTLSPTDPIHGELVILNPGRNAAHGYEFWLVGYDAAGAEPFCWVKGQGNWTTGGTVTAIRLYPSAGNMTSGLFSLYRRKNQ